jgi:hypothetical protein
MPQKSSIAVPLRLCMWACATYTARCLNMIRTALGLLGSLLGWQYCPAWLGVDSRSNCRLRHASLGVH